MTQRHTMFVREDYEHGYVALVRDQYHAEVTQVKTRSIKHIQQVARGYNATIFPKRFRHATL